MNIKFILFCAVSIAFIAAGCTNTTPVNQVSQVEQQADNTIVIEEYAFTPATLTIKKGTTVTWINNDEAKHTVTAVNGSGPQSELLSRGEKYMYTFTEPGKYEYICEPHPYMKGVIEVE